MYKILNENVSSEVIEKKSKFIANVFIVNSREEAEEKIKELKKKYHDARHNCYAYRIMQYDSTLADFSLIEKSSDDGEPSGTAGSPMLAILQGHDLVNVLVLVTRYFGGILLGTGGLVRCYSDSTSKAIENATLTQCDVGIEATAEIDYSDLSKAQYYFKQNDIAITNTDYNENICITIELSNEKFDILKNSLNELNFKIISLNYIDTRIIKII